MNTSIQSASLRVTNDLIFKLCSKKISKGVKILDFGAGKGHMCQRIGDMLESMGLVPSECISACEIDNSGFEYKKINCLKIGADSKIPFPDDSLDVVYAIEVIEHLKCPYTFIDEAYRVLKKDGMLILSTPNCGHLFSRLAYLLTGFFSFYPPPSVKEANAGRICGHIMPLGFSYLRYGCLKSGFQNLTFHVDKRKRGILPYAIFLRPIMKLFSFIYAGKIKAYDGDLWAENKNMIQHANTVNALTARSIVVEAYK